LSQKRQGHRHFLFGHRHCLVCLAWQQARGEILGGVETFTSAIGLDPTQRNQLRVIPRLVAQIDRRVGF
jgi:hypothetical protein